MLIPRFSVRWLLILTAISAVLAFVASLAFDGKVWALALSLTLLSLLVTFALYALVFCTAWVIAELWRLATTGKRAASPFATHTPPPQLVQTADPD